MNRFILLLVCVLFSQLASSQVPLIFRPGPGLNDGTDEGGVNGGKDLYVPDWENINHGSEAGFGVSPISNCNNTTMVTLMKFDVSSLPNQVDSVKLVLHHFDPSAYCLSNCIADFHFAVVTQPWSETNVQFASLPAKDTPFYSLLNHQWNDSLKIKEYDITSTYLAWRTGAIANHGFEIYSSTVGCNNACVYFSGYTSDDTSNAGDMRPYLKIYSHTTGVSLPVATRIGLQCYPNPATSTTSLHFVLSESQLVQVRLFDLNGRIVHTADYNFSAGNNSITIPMHDLASGLYYYRLVTSDGEVSGKIVKK